MNGIRPPHIISPGSGLSSGCLVLRSPQPLLGSSDLQRFFHFYAESLFFLVQLLCVARHYFDLTYQAGL